MQGHEYHLELTSRVNKLEPNAKRSLKQNANKKMAYLVNSR